MIFSRADARLQSVFRVCGSRQKALGVGGSHKILFMAYAPPADSGANGGGGNGGGATAGTATLDIVMYQYERRPAETGLGPDERGSYSI